MISEQTFPIIVKGNNAFYKCVSCSLEVPISDCMIQVAGRKTESGRMTYRAGINVGLSKPSGFVPGEIMHSADASGRWIIRQSYRPIVRRGPVCSKCRQ